MLRSASIQRERHDDRAAQSGRYTCCTEARLGLLRKLDSTKAQTVGAFAGR